MSRTSLHPLGMIWYDEQDYLQLRGLMIDAETLPPTYEVWLRQALQAERAALGIGVPVVRATVRSANFLAWCSDHRARPDREGRSQFAFDYAHDLFTGRLREVAAVRITPEAH
ncbi:MULTISPECIES: hypothetical protein [Methylorubrum]|uniref:Uncharacterized protein n=1 Tax=Methylorubrum suomiense TaxID=144191 RepID=A0ABQ4V1A1_9HYPH|nr:MULTISPECIES: hypothetical protein [Methylobacteriaceae]GJE77498.1 hypothetical protein BGCPKDLD_4103 [Methylorubrum suomiense]